MKGRHVTAGALVLALAACTADEPATATVDVSPNRFLVDVAGTAEQQRDGLAGRDRLDKGTGMLFTFGQSTEQQVWMAGMAIALDVAWISDGQVLDVLTLDPCNEVDQDHCPRWTSPGDVDALLEVPAGDLAGVEAGDPVTVTTTG